MAVLPIVEYPHKILRTPTQPVTQFDDALQIMLRDMTDTLYHEDGAGLAANQVGIPYQIFIMDYSERETQETTRQPQIFINPRIIAMEGEALYQEGCLSIPDQYFKVKRAVKVTVTYQDSAGNLHTLTTDGRPAHCIQHETDHLNGITSFDRLTPLKRMLAMKKWEKYCRNNKSTA